MHTLDIFSELETINRFNILQDGYENIPKSFPCYTISIKTKKSENSGKLSLEKNRVLNVNSYIWYVVQAMAPDIILIFYSNMTLKFSHWTYGKLHHVKICARICYKSNNCKTYIWWRRMKPCHLLQKGYLGNVTIIFFFFFFVSSYM